MLYMFIKQKLVQTFIPDAGFSYNLTEYNCQKN
jgi:hypothetical protein